MMTSLSVGERYDATRPRLLRTLDEMERSGHVSASVYLTPGRTSTRTVSQILEADPELAEVVEGVGGTDTGIAVFLEPDVITAVVPPFPVLEDAASAGLDAAPMSALLARRRRVAVVMIRLGRYAVGVLDGDELIASKTDTRYVKSRHRAGGSSQRRFERSRERLARELYDKACEVASDTLRPFVDTLDYVLLGGEKQTVGGLLRRCEMLRRLEPITLERRLNIRRPGQRALDGIQNEVMTSRVIVFDRAAPD